jgi:hypothetical protein
MRAVVGVHHAEQLEALNQSRQCCQPSPAARLVAYPADLTAHSATFSRQVHRLSSDASPGLPLAAWASSEPVAVGSIRVRYPLMRGLLRSRQPAAGTAIRAREPAAAADWA